MLQQILRFDTYVDVHLSNISILLDYIDKWCLTRESSWCVILCLHVPTLLWRWMYPHLINLHFKIYEIVLWLLMTPISEKMGNVIHPQILTRYGKLQIIFALPIVHLQYRLHHIDWASFLAISVYGLRWSGKRRRKLELWRHQNKTKLQT